MTTQPRIRTTLAALAVVGLLGACGSSGDDDSDSSTSGSDDEARFDALVDYTECLREQGIDVADPQKDSEGNFTIEPPQGDEAQLEAAQEACKEHFDEATPERPKHSAAEDAEVQDQQVAAAACMREKGYDFPDPEFSGSGEPQGTPPEGSEPGDPNFEEFRADMEDCLEAAGADQPTGPGEDS